MKRQDIDKQKLFSSITCALTHDVAACEKCKACGKDAAEARMALIEQLSQVLGTELPWLEEK